MWGNGGSYASISEMISGSISNMTNPFTLPLLIVGTAVSTSTTTPDPLPGPALPFANTTVVLFNASAVGKALGPNHEATGCAGGPVLAQTPTALLAFASASFGVCADCQPNGVVQRVSTDGGRKSARNIHGQPQQPQ